MKKIISFCLCMLLMVCGCNGKKSNIKPLTKGITATATLTYYNECYECNIKVDKNGKTDMEITFPESIKGLTFHFDGDSVTAKYSGLEYKNDISALPEGMACLELYKILKDSFEEDVVVISENDSLYISGEKNEYRLFLGATGLPISAESEKLGFSVNFSNVTIIK